MSIVYSLIVKKSHVNRLIGGFLKILHNFYNVFGKVMI